MIEVKRKRACVNINVPVDASAMWQAIQAVVNAESVFTVADVTEACNAPLIVIRDYLVRLERARIVAKHGRRGGSFRLLKRPKLAPATRPEQEHLWTAMRALKSFTLQEAIIAAATDTQKIPRNFARRYVNRLVEGGFLAAGKQIGPYAETVYRLKPSMNTGPLAPTVLRFVAVLDRNMNVVHDFVDAEDNCA